MPFGLSQAKFQFSDKTATIRHGTEVAVPVQRAKSCHAINEGSKMSGKADEVKGRVKEAAGALTDNDKLRNEGKIDQAAGKVKQAVEKVVGKVQEAAKGANKR
jgi:uncharacterized protein YjbJ (UPF0337 family)